MTRSRADPSVKLSIDVGVATGLAYRRNRLKEPVTTPRISSEPLGWISLNAALAGSRIQVCGDPLARRRLTVISWSTTATTMSPAA